MLSPKMRQARRGKSNFLRRIWTQCACVCWPMGVDTQLAATLGSDGAGVLEAS